MPAADRDPDADHGHDRTPILASDAERDAAIVRLRDAVGEGRLTLEEFSERVGAAQLARTDADLATLSRDLPAATASASTPATVTETTGEQHKAICSHLIRRGPWSLSPRSRWRSLFGTIDLDLREARLQAVETVLQVKNTFGTVTVIVPDGVEVIVRGGGIFASQKIDAPQRSPTPGGPRLVIDCTGPGGTLYVRTRPPQSFSLKSLLPGQSPQLPR